MPCEAQIIGAARSDIDADEFKAIVSDAIREFVDGSEVHDVALEAFVDRIDYVTIDALGTDGWAELATKMREDAVRAFYFSVAPGLFGALAERIHQHGMATDQSRIVVEKPFGNDLATARALNDTLAEHFDEGHLAKLELQLAQTDEETK